MRTPWLLVLPVALATAALVQDSPPTLEQLSRQASAVCVGTVRDQRTELDGPQRLILTRTRLAVDHCVKGHLGPEVVVTEVGGTLGGTTLHNPARAEYQDGGTYLVFLVERATGGVRTFWGPYGRTVLGAAPGGGWTVESSVAGGPAAPLPDVLSRVQRALEVRP